MHKPEERRHSSGQICSGVLSVVFLLFGFAPVQAQIAPDAGSLRQQIEQQREINLPPAVRPQRVAPPPEIKPRDGLSVRVSSFRFAGNTLLNEQQLAPVVAEFLNRNLSFEGLQRATDAIAAAYRQAGWLVRAYLPEQDINDGVVTLQVVEARFAGMRIEGQAPQRVEAAEIDAFIRSAQRKGEPLRADALDRALLLIDDLPGISIAGTLAPGQAEGETALVIQVTDEPVIYGSVSLDNTGSRSTGSQRLTASLNVSSPGRRGELVGLMLMHTEGSDYGRLAVTVPGSYDGLRLGVNLSGMNYKVIEGAGADAQIRGRSNSMGLEINYPLQRSRVQNLYWSAGLDNKSFVTRDLTDTRSDYETYSLRSELSANRFDEFGGGGANSASAQLLWGRLASMRHHAQLETLERHYRKFTYNLSRQQALGANHSLLLTVQGQHATQVLDSSERFYVGGAQSVRAYPASELGGERGQAASAEWRWRVDSAWLLSAFIDQGRAVSLPASPSDQKTALTLRGHGLSGSWQGPQGLLVKLTWARRDGNNPKPTLSGSDADGTLRLNRFWLSASMPF
jgi:hemolysin activation/secretion protein